MMLLSSAYQHYTLISTENAHVYFLMWQ